MKHTRITSVLLLCILILTFVTSCGGEAGTGTPSDTQQGSVQSDNSSSAETTTEARELTDEEKLEQVVAAIPDKDYNGYEFRIATRSAKSAVWATEDVYSEAEDGEPINDAVFKRNRLLEDALNIKVVDAGNESDYPHAIVTKAVLAGEDAFDVITDDLSHLSTMATNGYLIDYMTVDSIDLASEWWDHELTAGLSILNRVYEAPGDISIMDNKG
nr:hypothetical protein [Clostridia bacterium]